MSVLFFVCFLFLIFLQGCHQPPSSTNEDGFKNYVDSNSTVNSTTSIAQPDNQQQPVTLVNAAFNAVFILFLAFEFLGSLPLDPKAYAQAIPQGYQFMLIDGVSYYESGGLI